MASIFISICNGKFCPNDMKMFVNKLILSMRNSTLDVWKYPLSPVKKGYIWFYENLIEFLCNKIKIKIALNQVYL
jgi:hypothetical protein